MEKKNYRGGVRRSIGFPGCLKAHRERKGGGGRKKMMEKKGL